MFKQYTAVHSALELRLYDNLLLTLTVNCHLVLYGCMCILGRGLAALAAALGTVFLAAPAVLGQLLARCPIIEGVLQRVGWEMGNSACVCDNADTHTCCVRWVI
jgi:hypothetical protein